jgi:hypothetical protein
VTGARKLNDLSHTYLPPGANPDASTVMGCPDSEFGSSGRKLIPVHNSKMPEQFSLSPQQQPQPSPCHKDERDRDDQRIERGVVGDALRHVGFLSDGAPSDPVLLVALRWGFACTNQSRAMRGCRVRTSEQLFQENCREQDFPNSARRSSRCGPENRRSTSRSGQVLASVARNTSSTASGSRTRGRCSPSIKKFSISVSCVRAPRRIPGAWKNNQ